MNSINRIVGRLHNTNLGLLMLRLAVGIVFVHAGWLKIQMGDMLPQVFGQMGIPAVLAYFVAYAEFLGGIALILGIGVRYVGIVLAIIMFVAMTKVHWANGYGLQNNGYEYVLFLLFSCVAIVTLGAGSLTVKRIFKRG